MSSKVHQNFALNKYYSDLQRVESNLTKPHGNSKIDHGYSSLNIFKDSTNYNPKFNMTSGLPEKGKNAFNKKGCGFGSSTVNVDFKVNGTFNSSSSMQLGGNQFLERERGSKVNKISIQNSRNANAWKVERPSSVQAEKMTEVSHHRNSNCNQWAASCNVDSRFAYRKLDEGARNSHANGVDMSRSYPIESYHEQKSKSKVQGNSRPNNFESQQAVHTSLEEQQEFLATCKNLYQIDCSGEEHNERELVTIIAQQINQRDAIFELASEYLGSNNSNNKPIQLADHQAVEAKLEEFFARQKMMVEIIEEFKKGSSLDNQEFDDYNALYYFLRGSNNKNTE